MKGIPRGLAPQDAIPPGNLEVLVSTLGDVRDQIAALRESMTMNSIKLRGCRYVVIPPGFSPTGQTTMRMSTRTSELLGWALWESGGSQSVVVGVRDAAGDVGDLVVPVQLPAGGSNFQRFEPGISFTRGVTLTIQAGSGVPVGAVFLGQS